MERIAGVAASAEGVLLDGAPDLVDGLRAELDHVERAEQGDGVIERVAQAAERIERGDLRVLSEGFVADGEPVDIALY